MCGISVKINKNNCSISEEEIKNMNSKIYHRGPDNEGIFINKNVGFGFQRLSIIDLSDLGNQPMHFYEKYVIVFNGEIFNYIEIKNELEKKGYKFNSASDTEVILASYDFWGQNCVNHFNGMWAFVLYDQEKNMIFCSRDRYGIKPIYYLNTHDFFILVSEPKQLLGLNNYTPKVNIDSINKFIINGMLNTDHNSFFQNINEISQGTNLVYDLYQHNFTTYKYYDQADIKINNDITYEEAISKFKVLFENAVKIRLRSDVSIASCLSGGLDSSSIVSKAIQIGGNNLSIQTFSSCYNDTNFDESEYIDILVSDKQLQSIKIYPNLDDLLKYDKFKEINYYHDQPIKSASHFSEYSVFKAARDNGKRVILGGQGADEFLAGYLPFPVYNYSLLKNHKYRELLSELKYQRINHYKVLI
jgi:asparagine synthase (glutamine-hydrolysing)